MAKFAYRMQSILDIKEKMEGQAKIAYGVANAKLMDEQGKLQQIMIRKAGYESQARNLVNGTIDVPKIKECKRCLLYTSSSIIAQMFFSLVRMIRL